VGDEKIDLLPALAELVKSLTNLTPSGLVAAPPVTPARTSTRPASTMLPVNAVTTNPAAGPLHAAYVAEHNKTQQRRR
jgi:hypothetical protein